MCGILGLIDPIGIELEEFNSLRDRMFYRGPDDAGTWKNDSATVFLGHRRLSILDLSPSGHQPMVSDCGRYVIVFNGEVYNYLELKVELEQLGHHFKGSGDTEVVLMAYRQWGDDCLGRFNGMFALAIWDKGTSNAPPSLFMARDRAGKKPFYFANRDRKFAFAS
jgi:asparagine synthase (glutamine-hydrolysing)